MHRNIIKALSGLSLLTISSFAFASGFQLFEQSAAGLGEFYAGAAAIADDASTAFYNPAGLVMLPTKQLVLSGVGIFTNLKVTGSNTTTTPNPKYPVGPPSLTYTEPGTAQGGISTLVPAVYFAMPINSQLYFGLAVESPFGLQTDYSDTSFLRYSSTDSELETIEVNPNLAYRITDKLSIGAGIDLLYADAELNAVAGSPGGGVIDSTYNAYDTSSTNKGSAWGLGWNSGVLYQFTSMTRVGLSYRSPITVNLKGDSSFTGALANQYNNGATITSNNLRTNITLPSIATLSIYQGITQQLAAMGSVNYTTWSKIKNITLNNVAGLTSALTPTANMSANLPQHFRNTWRLATGLNYAVTSSWILKAGAGYDENPTNNHDRNVRLPSSNDFALSAGTHWQIAKNLGLDVGYAHLFFEQTELSNTTVFGTQSSYVNAKVVSSANLVGGQLTWNIG